MSTSGTASGGVRDQTRIGKPGLDGPLVEVGIQKDNSGHLGLSQKSAHSPLPSLGTQTAGRVSDDAHPAGPALPLSMSLAVA